MIRLTQTAQTEFWFHVANQDEIPILGTVDKSFDMPLLFKVLSELPDTEASQKGYVQALIQDNTDILDILRPFVGVSDKRMYLELSYIFSKTKFDTNEEKNILGKSLYELQKHNLAFFKNLIKKDDIENQEPDLKKTGEPTIKEQKRQKKIKLKEKAREIIVDYLLNKNLLGILDKLKILSEAQWTVIVSNLINPKEMQQTETKLRGHSAERELAIVFHELGVNYLPPNKHTNPMALM